MKYLVLSVLLFLAIGLSSCLPTQTISKPTTTVSTIEDLSGKWYVNQSDDYIIFEDATKKMVLKTSCGLITGNYTKINQAVIFNQLKQVNADCEISSELIQKLQKTAYFKVISTNKITFFDESHQEKLTLNLLN